MKIKGKLVFVSILLVILLTGCLPSESPVETSAPADTSVATMPTFDVNQVATLVAEAVQAEQTKIAQTIADEVSRQVNTAVAVELTRMAPTQTPTDSPAIPTAVQVSTPTNTPVPPENPQLDLHAELVADVTVADNTVFVAGDSFVKTWRLRNIGKLTWTTDFSIVFINGNRMEGQAAKLPREVQPGGTIDLSVEMIAPAQAGTYQGFWGLQDDEDNLFGIGLSAQEYFFVQIVVVSPTVTPTPTATAQPSPTP